MLIGKEEETIDWFRYGDDLYKSMVEAMVNIEGKFQNCPEEDKPFFSYLRATLEALTAQVGMIKEKADHIKKCDPNSPTLPLPSFSSEETCYVLIENPSMVVQNLWVIFRISFFAVLRRFCEQLFTVEKIKKLENGHIFDAIRLLRNAELHENHCVKKDEHRKSIENAKIKDLKLLPTSDKKYTYKYTPFSLTDITVKFFDACIELHQKRTAKTSSLD